MKKCLKAAICLFTVIQLFVTGTHALAVQDDENAVDLSYFQENDTRGGDCVLKSSVLVKNGENLDRIISVYVQDDGKYFLSAWVKHINGQTLKVYLDDQRSPLGIMPTPKTGWQSSQLVGSGGNQKKISMTQGQHTFTFRCKGPVAPSAEYVRLAGSKADSMISDTEYQNYIGRLKSVALPDDYIGLKQSGEDNSVTEVRNVIPPDTPPSDIPVDYVYKQDLSFTYTNYINIYLYAGQSKIFETKKDNPYGSDPVMHLFSQSDPFSFSLTDEDSGVGPQSKITCTVPSDGWYILLLRAQGQYHGTTDVYMGDLKIDSDAPIAGSMVSCSQMIKTGQTVNYFTSNLSGYMADTRIWLIDSNNKVAAYNNDYQNSDDGTHIWGYASRVKGQFYTQIYNVLVSAFVPRSGTCDLYMKCNNSTIMKYFPNLKEEDAIRSAPETNSYNCISWSGGSPNLGYFWPPNPGNPWTGSTGLESFDNFYGNTKNWKTVVRYNGAMNYTRIGADENNAAIALWSDDKGYTHASVKKPGNDQPHGYDWESKPGGFMRTFHPRHALSGPTYGEIDKYYRWDGTYSYGDPPMKLMATGESGSIGHLEKVEFNQLDKGKLDELLSVIPEKDKNEFEKKYKAWIKTWSDPMLQVHSNPRMFAKSEEYDDLLSFCEEKEKLVWPLIFSKYNQGDELAMNIIEDLTFNEYSYVMDNIHNDNNLNRSKTNYVIPSQRGNWTKYIINVLSEIHADNEKDEP